MSTSLNRAIYLTNLPTCFVISQWWYAGPSESLRYAVRSLVLYRMLTGSSDEQCIAVTISWMDNDWLQRPPLVAAQQDQSRHEVTTCAPGRGRWWDLLRPAHFYPFNIPLLLPARLGGESSSSSSVDLSATLVTDTDRLFGGHPADGHTIDDYVAAANRHLPIPLPRNYLEALRARAAVYKKWPQYITVSNPTLSSSGSAGGGGIEYTSPICSALCSSDPQDYIIGPNSVMDFPVTQLFLSRFIFVEALYMPTGRAIWNH